MNLLSVTKIFLLSSLALLFSIDNSFAQKRKNKKQTTTEDVELKPWEIDTLINPIPMNRALFAGYVDKQIEYADMRDGTIDGLIEISDTLLSKALTQALLVEAPLIKIHIENLEISHQQKIQYHRMLESMLKRLNSKIFGNTEPSYYRKIVRNFEGLLIAREEGDVMDFVKENADIYTMDNRDLLEGYPEAETYVFETLGNEYPEMMIARLPEFAQKSYADPIVAAAAKVLPGTILQYALSTSRLSAVVRRNQDPLVKSIVKIATESKEPWKTLPFLGEIHSGNKKVSEIDAVTGNAEEYFKALVDLKVNNQTMGAHAIDKEINHRGLLFVRVVNELHNSPAPVRFKSLTNFRPEDLYFMMLASQNEIYTSSFVWMFNRMMDQMKPQTGDQLLEKVHKSHFRSFIRMCAGYNTLAPFLASMDEAHKIALMKEFVANLERGSFDNLEDAVDVADAFGSITDESMIEFLKKEVRSNYERTYKANNKQSEKGIIIYGLLSTIFNTAQSSEGLGGALNDLIPPITYVPHSALLDSSGHVIQQMFFYGDKDGRADYQDYINSYKNGKWKITTGEYWTTLTSTSGNTPMTIYANRPLPEETGEDEKAQKELAAYLEKNNIVPTVIIHRGHSYYLPTTLEYLNPLVKIVMLGSCGGYHNLSQVLSSSPDAHIISSKQIGARHINQPIIHLIDRLITEGKDVNWVEMWGELNKRFAGSGAATRDLFSDYVPPNRNLGAIFIKAYRKQAMLLDEAAENY